MQIREDADGRCGAGANSPHGLEPEQLTGHLGILLLTGFYTSRKYAHQTVRTVCVYVHPELHKHTPLYHMVGL